VAKDEREFKKEFLLLRHYLLLLWREPLQARAVAREEEADD